MRSTKPFTSLLVASLLVISGCATTSDEKDAIPEWVGDGVKRDVPKSDSAKSESPADASTLFGFLSKKYLGNEDKTGDKTEANEPKGEEPKNELTVEIVEKPTLTAVKTKDQTPPQAIPSKVIPKPKKLIAKNAEHEKLAKAAETQYRAALSLMKSGDLDEAISRFKSLSAQYPLLSGPVVNQGIALRKQGKLKQAKALLQDALFKKYQNPYLLNELGAINRDLGNFKQAKQAYLSAIRIDAAYSTPHFNLAVLADLYLHDPELALQEFTIYQSMQEKPAKKVKGWIKEIKRRIKRMKKSKS